VSGIYRRYADTPSGVSPMVLPGTPGGAYTADGLEHGERGTPSSQAADHIAQLAKRRRKLELHDYGDKWADIEGSGELAVVTFGSCTAPVREALSRLGPDAGIRLVSLRLLAPLLCNPLRTALTGVRKVLVIEQNESGQLYSYLKGYACLPAMVDSLRRPGARQFNPGEVHQYLLRWASE
jgi:2-oxoglutarate ferredoxin oxidoreductase subunit alpha